MDYLRIFRELNKANVDYLVVGGLAVNLHGVPRMTYDLDLMIRLDQENVTSLLSLLAAWGYRPRVPVDPADLADQAKRRRWREEKNMRALSFHHDRAEVGQIDILIDEAGDYERLKANALAIAIRDTRVPIPALGDLIGMKRASARAQDVADAEALTALAALAETDEGL